MARGTRFRYYINKGSLFIPSHGPSSPPPTGQRPSSPAPWTRRQICSPYSLLVMHGSASPEGAASASPRLTSARGGEWDDGCARTVCDTGGIFAFFPLIAAVEVWCVCSLSYPLKARRVPEDAQLFLLVSGRSECFVISTHHIAWPVTSFGTRYGRDRKHTILGCRGLHTVL